MKNFNSIVALINRLSDSEFKIVEKQFSFQGQNSLNKSLSLIKYIKDDKSPNARGIQLKLYQANNEFAFNKLIDRVRGKILDVLLNDINIINSNYPERIRVNFELRKKLIQSDLLSLKGLRDEADKLCKKIITKAKTYELYDIIAQACLIRQRFASVRKKTAEVKKIYQSVELYEKKYKSFIKCQLEYNSALSKISNARNKSSYYDELINSIYIIKQEYSISKSNLSLFYCNMLTTYLLQTDNKYNEAEKYLKSLLDLVQKKSVYSSLQMGTILLNISSNYLHLEKYVLAFEYAKQAKPLFSGNIINSMLVDEQVFYSYFYMGEYKKAHTIAQDYFNISRSNNTPFNIFKWKYFMATIYFVNKEYLKCYNLMNEIDDQKIINEDWNVNRMLLQIMCLIELNELEQAETHIEIFSRYIKRITAKSKLFKRQQLISKILLKLSNSRFDFNEVLKSRLKYFALFSEIDSVVAWIPKEAEIIPFHKWFLSKV